MGQSMEPSMPNWKQSEKSSNEISSRFVHRLSKSIIAIRWSRLWLLQVSIYFGTVEVSSVIESPQFTVNSFINSLGGALSLFLGCSFVQLFESVELVIRMIYSLFTQYGYIKEILSTITHKWWPKDFILDAYI